MIEQDIGEKEGERVIAKAVQSQCKRRCCYMRNTSHGVRDAYAQGSGGDGVSK